MAACVQGCILISFSTPSGAADRLFPLIRKYIYFDTFHPVLDEQKPFVMSCQTFILLLIEGEVRLLPFA